jgi:hypothetical protein
LCILPTEFDILKTFPLPELKKDKFEYMQQNSALSHWSTSHVMSVTFWRENSMITGFVSPQFLTFLGKKGLVWLNMVTSKIRILQHYNNSVEDAAVCMG